MEDDSLTFAAQAKALRETRDAWLGGERKSLGAEQFEQAESGANAALAELKGRLDDLVAEARSRGFNYFACRLKSGRPRAICTQFGDGKGNYYQRSIGLTRLLAKHGCPANWDITITMMVRNYISRQEAVKRMDYGMTCKQVTTIKEQH